MHAFHSARFALALPEGHRFPSGKYALLRDRVKAELPGIELIEPPEASDDELALVHKPSYIAAVAQGLLTTAEMREIGFPWNAAMAQRARRSVGATIAAARAAMSQGLAANLAGGTHHASAERGGGYCVFNDVAVAARLMQAEWLRVHQSPLQVAVVDLDVHQGNGTAELFQGDPTVFTLSLHAEKNFPFRKEASDLDIGLPDGCGDADYLLALDDAMGELWRRHADAPPGLIFYLAGADPHEGDRLGRLRLSSAGLAERDRRVLTQARERRIPVALAMAGGYGRDIADTVAIHVQTLREALHSWQEWNNRAP